MSKSKRKSKLSPRPRVPASPRLSLSKLLGENAELRAQLAEAEETLRAIREGEVDALVVSGPKGEQVYSLAGADSIYRLIVETMKEAAFTVALDGTILFCNAQFGMLVKRPMEQIVGRRLNEFVAPDSRALAESLLILSGKQPVKQRLVLRDSQEQQVPVHVSAHMLNQPDGQSICIVAADLTALENSTEMIQRLRRQQEALQAANEELAATEEELRVQNEELAASRVELDRARARYEDLFETAPDGYISADAEGIIQQANQAAVRLFGRSASDLKGNPFSALLPMSNREGYLGLLASLMAGKASPPPWEVELRPLEGPPFWVAITVAASLNEEGNIVGLRWLIRDVAVRKQAEETIRRQAAILEGINQVFHAVLTNRTAEELGIVCLGIAEKLTQSKFGFIGEINDKGLEDIAVSNPGWNACSILDVNGHRGPPGNFPIHGLYGRVLSDGKSLFTNDPAHHPDRIGLSKDHPPLESFLGVPLIREGRTIGIIAVANRPAGYSQVEQEALEALAPAIVQAFMRKRAEEALRMSEEKFRSLFENSPDAIFMIDLEGSIMVANPAACAVFGGSEQELCSLGRSDIVDIGDPRLSVALEERRRTGRVVAKELTAIRRNGEKFPVEVDSVILPGEPLRSFVIMRDIASRKQAEDALRQAAEELERSNKDLEQFAYVASHDLQEPLRQVTGFMSLLRGRYKDQLDDKAREYIDYSIDGANRMSVLIKNLLEYSRVSGEAWVLVPTNAQKSLDAALTNLQGAIGEFDAKVSFDPLPTVMADGPQLARVFQNLIGNAIKFRKKDVAPEIHIGAKRVTNGEWGRGNGKWGMGSGDYSARSAESGVGAPAEGGTLAKIAATPSAIGGATEAVASGQDVRVSSLSESPRLRVSESFPFWLFSVRDNGIGIPPEQQDRIFLIFQRLHGREEYPGTGIGLAICKKIVERHGGRMWVESEPGQGSAFFFTLGADLK